mgnify:CR=1 FL=1
MSFQKYYLNWEEVNVNWDLLDINWEDIYILIEVKDRILRGSSGGSLKDYIDGNPWKKLRKEVGEEKTKKFIKLFCKINDLEYESVAEVNEDVKLTVSQFEKVFENVPNIKIKI